MTIHKKLFIVGWSLVIGSVGLMIADKSFLDCIVVPDTFNVFVWLDDISALLPFLTIIGILELVVTLVFYRIKQGKKLFALTGEVVLVVVFLLLVGSLFLAAMNSSRNKGPNAAIKATISNLRAHAEIHYDRNQTYLGFCASEEFKASRTSIYDIKNQTHQGLFCPAIDAEIDVACSETKNSYVVLTMLIEKPQTGEYFCVDNSGFAGIVENYVDGIKCK